MADRSSAASTIIGFAVAGSVASAVGYFTESLTNLGNLTKEGNAKLSDEDKVMLTKMSYISAMDYASAAAAGFQGTARPLTL